MKKIYTVITSIYNGTVTVHIDASSFYSKELADEVRERIDKANEDAFFKIRSRVQESDIYESRDEVPVLTTPLDELKARVTTSEEFLKSRPKMVIREEPIDLTKVKEVKIVSKKIKL